MIDLRKIIQGQLKAIHPRVYFQMAPKTATFPYLVYDIPTINDDGEGYQLATIDIDGWDNENDTTVLETLMNSVNNALNKKSFVYNNTALTPFLESKLSLRDDEAKLKRRKNIYQGRIFKADKSTWDIYTEKTWNNIAEKTWNSI